MEQKMNGFRAKLDYALKHNVFFNKCFNVVMSSALKFIGWFIPIDKKMVVFSAHGRKYNDSPRAIYEYLLKQERFADLKCVWALEDLSVDIPGNPIKVKADSWLYFKHCLKAKYWITCVNIERSLHFQKKSQLYLNTWHGVALNTMGNECFGRKDFDFSNINFFAYESEFQKKHIIAGFNVREESLIPAGLPRNDELYNTTKEEIKRLKEQLRLPLDKKIILYAPTWRDSTNKGASYELRPPINLDKWKEELGDEYVLLLRTHSYTTDLLGVQFDEFVRNMTPYPKVNDLFKVSDILISDYSSCITDFSILERPIICFTYDYEDYCEVHGLNVDFRTEMPNGIQRTEEEVINLIETMDYDEQCSRTRDMVKNVFTNIGGNACKICVDTLFRDYKN